MTVKEFIENLSKFAEENGLEDATLLIEDTDFCELDSDIVFTAEENVQAYVGETEKMQVCDNVTGEYALKDVFVQSDVERAVVLRRN